MNKRLHAIGYVALVEALASLSKHCEIKSSEDLDTVIGGMNEAINDLSLESGKILINIRKLRDNSNGKYVMD